MRRIKEAFSITGRGTAVAVHGVSDLPVARALYARVFRPDGTVLEAVAYKEWLLRRAHPAVIEDEAFLLVGIEKADVPLESLVDIQLEQIEQ